MTHEIICALFLVPGCLYFSCVFLACFNLDFFMGFGIGCYLKGKGPGFERACEGLLQGQV